MQECLQNKVCSNTGKIWIQPQSGSVLLNNLSDQKYQSVCLDLITKPYEVKRNVWQRELEVTINVLLNV